MKLQVFLAFINKNHKSQIMCIPRVLNKLDKVIQLISMNVYVERMYF